MENESEVLDKALSVLNNALEGKVIDPGALDTAIRMTQFFWSSVFAERVRERQITENLKNKWENTIEEKEDQ
jgi:hypothetical protein